MRPDLTTDDINLALSAVGMVLNMTTAPNEAGTVAALLVRDPFRIGYEGVKTALAAAKGEQVPPTWISARASSPRRSRRSGCQFGINNATTTHTLLS